MRLKSEKLRAKFMSKEILIAFVEPIICFKVIDTHELAKATCNVLKILINHFKRNIFFLPYATKCTMN